VTGTNQRNGVVINGQTSSCTVNIDSCFVRGISSGTGIGRGISAGDLQATVNIYNTIVADFKSGSDSSHYGILGVGSPLNVYNCTIYGCYYGVNDSGNVVTVKNCAIGNCDDDIYSANVVDYCCTDDGDGDHAQGPSGGSWANEFDNAAGYDFSLKSGGNCVGNGVDDPGSGLYSDDIIDVARSSTWDIGAFEYVAAGPSAAPQIIYIMVD